MVLAAKRRLGQAWTSMEKRWPGGMRDGRILRFAEADTDYGVGWFLLLPLTRLSPDKRLAVLSPQSGTRPAPFFEYGRL